MDWYDTVFEVIDMRSFSNLWFWIALAVVWSSASHWVLGVPFDMVSRARRNGGQAEADLEELVRINVNRVLFIVEEAGLWLAALGAAFLTGLALLGFVYGIELAQAIFLLAFPMTLVGLLSVTHGPPHPLWRRPGRGALAPVAHPPRADAGDRHGFDLRHRAVGHVPEPLGAYPLRGFREEQDRLPVSPEQCRPCRAPIPAPKQRLLAGCG